MKKEYLETFRHEFKYTISYAEMLKLKEKLSEVMKIDRNESGYMIRSMYFDSLENDDYYDKLAGIKDRKKVRLRIYEFDKDYVKLEVKRKDDVHQLKQSIIITKKEALSIINGDYDILLKLNDEVANKMYLILREGTYKPVNIIEYTRLAFITTTSTRITFDYDIKTSIDYDNFFNQDINYLDVSNKNQVVLEIKFDRFLEPYLGSILANYISLNESVSKYVLSRNKIEGVK